MENKLEWRRRELNPRRPMITRNLLITCCAACSECNGCSASLHLITPKTQDRVASRGYYRFPGVASEVCRRRIGGNAGAIRARDTLNARPHAPKASERPNC